jgi:hypothetical protein
MTGILDSKLRTRIYACYIAVAQPFLPLYNRVISIIQALNLFHFLQYVLNLYANNVDDERRDT